MTLNHNTNYPLSGIRVIDFSTVVAAPTTGRFLADLGADVIKVETEFGDSTRYQDYELNEKEQFAFTNANSNKKCISIDTKSVSGKEVFLKLVEHTDILLTNVRYRSLIKMGLDYGSLKKEYPRLIYAHFSGYGYEGEDADLPGFDMTAFWSRGGAMIDGIPHGTDAMFVPPYGFGDLFSSGSFTIGVLAALFGRERTDQGTFVSSSLIHNGLWANSRNVIPAQEKLGTPIPVPPEKDDSMFYKGYRCSDGKWLMLALNPHEKFWDLCCDLFELDEFRDDKRYANALDMVNNNLCVPLEKKVRAVMQSKPRDVWMKLLKERDMVFAPMQGAAEASKDKQMWENQCFENVVFQSGTMAAMPTIPLRFSNYSVKKVSPGHFLGEDTENILLSIGYSENEIEDMKKRGNVK